jgi:hypothetical protein
MRKTLIMFKKKKNTSKDRDCKLAQIIIFGSLKKKKIIMFGEKIIAKMRKTLISIYINEI